MKPIKYTDAHKFREPYVTAKDSQEPNYLRDKFAKIAEAQTRNAAEVEAKVRKVGRK